jgi:hypothetical protein
MKGRRAIPPSPPLFLPQPFLPSFKLDVVAARTEAHRQRFSFAYQMTLVTCHRDLPAENHREAAPRPLPAP